jgi:ankyrin repeat protein
LFKKEDFKETDRLEPRNLINKKEELINIDYFVEAAKKGDTASLRRMISKGIDVNAKDKYGWVAIIMASANGHKDAVNLLLNNGANPNLPAWNGETALMRASASGHKEIVNLLLKHGANVNSRDNDGLTAIMRTAYTGQRSVIELLLDKGADVNAKDNHGRTAWTFAAERGHNDLLKYLEQYGKRHSIKINMPPPLPKDPVAEVTSLLFVLQADYGVMVYRNESDEIKIGTDPEKKVDNSLNNPKVKQLLEELYNFPQEILYSCLPKAVSSEIRITELFDKTNTKPIFRDNGKLIDFKEFKTKKAGEAVEVLMTKAIFAVPSISESEVIEEYKGVRLSWLSKELVKGSLSRVKKIILSNLEELVSLNRFDEFSIDVYPDQKCAQVNVLFINPPAFLGIRLWRTQDAIFACGDKEFRSDSTTVSQPKSSQNQIPSVIPPKQPPFPRPTWCPKCRDHVTRGVMTAVEHKRWNAGLCPTCEGKLIHLSQIWDLKRK